MTSIVTLLATGAYVMVTPGVAFRGSPRNWGLSSFCPYSRLRSLDGGWRLHPNAGGIAVAIVFLMTVKPGRSAALLAIGVASALGLASGLATLGRDWAPGRTILNACAHRETAHRRTASTTSPLTRQWEPGAVARVVGAFHRDRPHKNRPGVDPTPFYPFSALS